MTEQERSEVVVITGASSGIGRATVREFAKQKKSIALLARNVEALEAAKHEAESVGAKAIVIQTDVSDPEQVEQAATRIEEELGPIDIWVNNAMVSVFAPFNEIEPDEFKRVTEVTYLGYVYGTMAALKRMLSRNRGIIVQVSSALAHRSIPLQSAYCGAKHAIKGFTESINCELSHEKSSVKISMVSMPAVNTPQFELVENRLSHKPQPVPPIYQPELAARAIVWASEHTPRELLLGLSTWKAVWGEKFIPGLLDRYLGKIGYSSQQTDEPKEPLDKNNLWSPIPGDHGAHGAFDDKSKTFSTTLWLTENRSKIVSTFAFIAIAGLGMLVKSNLTRSRIAAS